MLDTKLSKIGKLTIENGQMHAIGFDTDKPMMCREVAAHVCVWAIGQLQEELARILAAPGGNMAVDSECDWCGENEIHLAREHCDPKKQEKWEDAKWAQWEAEERTASLGGNKAATCSAVTELRAEMNLPKTAEEARAMGYIEMKDEHGQSYFVIG